MNQTVPIFGSLGSNYSLKFACQALWWYIFPPNLRQTQTDLSAKLLEYFPEFTDPYFFSTGRDAIQFSLQALSLPQNAKVLTQAFTCAAIEEAILGAKLQPVFVDLAEHSINLNVETLQKAFAANPDARVVLVQHLLGYPAAIVAIRDWCNKNNLLLIEDLAQSFGSHTSDKKLLGSFGDIVVTSFGRDKVIDVVAGGCCLFRKNLLVEEPSRHLLRSRSDWRQAFYPLLTVIIRATFSLGLGKVLQRVAVSFGIITSPVLRTTPLFEKLSVGQARLVFEQLHSLSQALEHRAKIAAIYERFLFQYAVSPATTDKLSPLRFAIIARDPATLTAELKKHNFYLSDRWYRSAVDAGSTKWNTTYQVGSCLAAEALASTVFTLPTHRQITPQVAARLATVILGQLDIQQDYVVREITKKEIWEDWLANRVEANFLQSWHWGEFQRKLGKEIARIGLYEKSNLIGVALMIFERARRGTYCSLPGGPLLDWDRILVASAFFSHLRTIAKQHGCSFLRFRPQVLENPGARAQAAQLGAVPAAMHVTADRTIEIDLAKDNEQILAQMRKNTRSAIKKAEKLGIRTTVSRDPSAIKQFYEEQRLVAARHDFVPFSYDFLVEQFRIFAENNQAILVSAYQGEQLLASAFVLMYHQQAVYHYGVSTDANTKLPGSYAVQWRVIIEAKQHGCQSYNLWGVAPPGVKGHRFAGVSLFKRGFGGREVQYLEAQDIPLSPRFWVVRVFELVRKWRRRL